MEQYTRKYYHSRGLRQERDDVYNSIVEFKTAGICMTCGERLERKIYGRRYETWRAFSKRKTCGKTLNSENKWEMSECQRQLSVGKNNGNYKGIMPKCIICGKKTSYRENGEGGSKYCMKHYKEKAYKEGLYEECGKRLVKQGFSFKKGDKPKLPFKKGSIPYNKGKIFEEIYGKTKAKTLKRKLSKLMKDKLKPGGSCYRGKEKVKINCTVCGKEIFVIPYRAKTQKTCGFRCSGKLKSRCIS